MMTSRFSIKSVAIFFVVCVIGVPTVSEADEEVIIDLDALEEDDSANEKQASGQGGEQVISLDDLDGDDGAGNKVGKVAVPGEPMLPIEITEVELEKRPVLKVAAVAVLFPVIAMLFRPRRRKRRTPVENSREEI